MLNILELILLFTLLQKFMIIAIFSCVSGRLLNVYYKF